MNLKKGLIILFIAIVAVYLIFGILLFFMQKSMIYYPDKQGFDNCVDFNDYQKVEFNGTRFYYKENSANLIVFYHGNAGSACDRSYLKSIFEQTNKSIIFAEYSGYSNDSKNPGIDLILEDVQNIHNFIVEKSFDNINVYGESIGTGAASYHASLGNVDNLILVSPFSTMERVVQSKYIIYPASLLLTEKYDNLKWLKNFNGSVRIIHGNSDSIIPHELSQELFDNIPSKDKEYVLIEGGGHNDLWGSNDFVDNIADFIKK